MFEHKNIIGIREWVETDSEYIIIMEKATCDLMDLISEGFLNEDNTPVLFFNIVQGIKEMHKKGVAHLDIKPENIFVSNNMTAKVGDFGSCYFWNKKTNPTGLISGVVGTRFYYAPEVKTNAYDAFKADIYSLGILFYVMLTGAWPFAGTNYEEVCENAEQFNLFFDPSFIHKISPEAFHLLNWMLLKDPSHRPSIEQVFNHPLFRHQRTSPVRHEIKTRPSVPILDLSAVIAA